MKQMKTMLALCAMALVTTAVYAAECPDIKIDDLKSAIASHKVVLLDANGSDSYKEGHIPGAIDFSAHHDNLASVLPKDKHALVVAYCGGPKCTAYKSAAKAAEKLGYTNVKHLAAGISGWRDSGQKVEKGT